MAHQAVAFHFHAEQQRVVVAVGGRADDAQAIAAGLALHPELLPAAAPERHVATFERAADSSRRSEIPASASRPSSHPARFPVPVHRSWRSRSRYASFIAAPSSKSCGTQEKGPLALCAWAGLFRILMCVLSSPHRRQPPTRYAHGDGGGRDDEASSASLQG